MKQLVVFLKYCETGEVVKTIEPKYVMGDVVYFLEEKRKEVVVVKTEILERLSIRYTNVVSYQVTSAWGNVFKSEENLYDDKEKAYEEAKKRLGRKKIKYKEYTTL